MQQVQKIIVLGLIHNSLGQVLIHQRFDPQIPQAHRKWDIPGGKNEIGESLEATVRREVKEETSIDIAIEQLLPHCVSKTWQHEAYLQHTLVFCYKCKYLNGTAHSSDKKVRNLRWVSHDELGKYYFLETTREFMAA